ncbi:MAG: hypothetical protein ABDH21_01370 [bacterium]
MNLFTAPKVFSSISSLTIPEYIYILNYTKELIKKYDQGLLDNTLINYPILVLELSKHESLQIVVNIIQNISFFCRKMVNLSFIPAIQDIYKLVFVVDLDGNFYNLKAENIIYINRETLSVFLGLSYFIDSLESDTYDKIDLPVDHSIISQIVSLIYEKKEYLKIEENIELERRYLSYKSVMFLMLGTSIIMIRKV